MSYLKSGALDAKRQVLGLTEVIAQEKGMLAGIALANGARIPRVKAEKLEKKIMKEGRIKTTVTNLVASGYFDEIIAKDLVVGDTSNYLVGDIIEFRTADNKTLSNISVGVDSKIDGTTLKVKKVGGTDVEIPAGATAILTSSTNEEVSNKSLRPMNVPQTMYNYCQIIRESRGVSGRATVINQWDFNTAIGEARRQVLEYFARQLDAICMSSSRTTVILGGEERYVAGGLPFFADNLFNNKGEVVVGTPKNRKDAAGAALTQDMIDDGFQYVIEEEGRLNTILTSPAQARKISAFDEGKIVINYEQLNNAENQSRGGSVQILKSPITINGNVIDKIYVSTAVAKDVVRMFDRSKMYLVPMDGRSYNETSSNFESTDLATDGVTVDMLGDWTFLFENADIYTYTIENLEV